MSAAQAKAAKANLKQGTRYVTSCKPCGEKTHRGPFTVKSVTSRVPQKGYVEIVVNRSAVDLAYVYVEAKPGQFRNLAKLAPHPASGVPAMLKMGAPASTQKPPRR